MTRRFYKHKLLLDENMAFRRHFPKLNSQYDVKHIVEDLQKGGSADPDVYDLAASLERLIITSNYRHFLPHLKKSTKTGVIGISGNLPESQMDTKLVAFLKKTPTKSLYGAFHYISGESKT
jgi:hypothetical protein